MVLDYAIYFLKETTNLSLCLIKQVQNRGFFKTRTLKLRTRRRSVASFTPQLLLSPENEQQLPTGQEFVGPREAGLGPVECRKLRGDGKRTPIAFALAARCLGNVVTELPRLRKPLQKGCSEHEL
jgi:hypothetical protein